MANMHLNGCNTNPFAFSLNLVLTVSSAFFFFFTDAALYWNQAMDAKLTVPFKCIQFFDKRVLAGFLAACDDDRCHTGSKPQ